MSLPKKIVTQVGGRNGSIVLLVVLFVALLASLVNWNSGSSESSIQFAAAPTSVLAAESRRPKSHELSVIPTRPTAPAESGQPGAKRSALELTTSEATGKSAALNPGWSEPRQWFGRIVLPEERGMTRSAKVAGLELGIAFWRRSSQQPFPSREAWIANGKSQAKGTVELTLPSIDKLRAGNAEILVEAPGRGLAIVPLDWLATSRETEQVIPLERPARIIVHVQEPEGAMLQGVIVELSGRFAVESARTWFSNAKKQWKTVRSWTATTDEQGAARFPTAPAERELSVRLVRDGVEVWKEDGVVFARPEETLHLSIRLQAPFQGHVFGVVKTYGGEPCEGYEIRAGCLPNMTHRDELLGPIPPSSLPYFTKTDEEGRYSMDLPLRGLVTVAAQPTSQALQQRRHTVRLKDSVPEREVNFVVSVNRTVSGEITGPDGAPVSGAIISLVRPAFAHSTNTPLAAWLTRSDKRGRFQLKKLPGGPLVLDVKSDAGVLPAPVAVGNGRLKLQLEASGTVPFQIVAPPGVAHAMSADIQIFSSKGVLVRQMKVISGVEQRVSGLPSGRYTLIVFSSRNSPSPLFGRLDDVFIPPLGEAPELRIKLEPSPLAQLRLVRRSHHGTTKITLQHDRTLETQAVELGRLGSVNLQLTAGLWELRWLSKHGIEETLSIVLAADETRELEDAFD